MEKVQNTQTQNTERTIIILKNKSVGTAILLAIIFPVLGMLYSTIKGTVCMIILLGIIIYLFFSGNGLPAIILFVLHFPIALIWTVIATKRYNRKLLLQATTPSKMNLTHEEGVLVQSTIKPTGYDFIFVLLFVLFIFCGLYAIQDIFFK